MSGVTHIEAVSLLSRAILDTLPARSGPAADAFVAIDDLLKPQAPVLGREALIMALLAVNETLNQRVAEAVEKLAASQTSGNVIPFPERL